MHTVDNQLFLEHGILHLPGFVDRKLVTAAKRSIEADLEKSKGQLTSAKFKDRPVFQQIGQISGLITGGEVFERLFSDELLKIMQKLAQSKLKPMHPSPQVLVSMPHKEEWSLANLNWHLDLKVPKQDEVPGVQAFVLIDDLMPKGGATLAISGSHRLHYLKDGQNAHGILKQSREFTNTPDKFLKPQSISGIPVQIVEMSGKAGDVYLMDLRTLHSPSVNATKKIRMMATQRWVV